MAYDLTSFVKEALEKKVSRSEIRNVLERAGWERAEIDAALGEFAEVSFPIAVPKRKPYLSAREAFLYLLLFLTLYVSAFHFGRLLFSFVDRAFPDALQQFSDGSLARIRSSLASLIVAFPIFLGISWHLDRVTRDRPEKKGSKIRKWLTYVTLFVAAGVIIGDLIALITNLLGGELTTRFLLKVIIVLVIAGSIFGYYLWDLRKDEKENV